MNFKNIKKVDKKIKTFEGARPQATNAEITYAMQLKKSEMEGKEHQGNPPQHS